MTSLFRISDTEAKGDADRNGPEEGAAASAGVVVGSPKR